MTGASGYVQGLLIERAGYVQKGQRDRIAQVDIELARFGVAVDRNGNADVPAHLLDDVETTQADHTAVETKVVKPRRGRRSKATEEPAAGDDSDGTPADE